MRPDIKAGPSPRNFIADTNPELIPGASSFGSSVSCGKAGVLPTTSARQAAKIQCLRMMYFDLFSSLRRKKQIEKRSRRPHFNYGDRLLPTEASAICKWEPLG
jgi:hypothetical protein